MKFILLLLITGALVATPALATVRYVNANNAEPVSPYNTWARAARTIQQAIDVSVNGDVIRVTNGTYNTSGRIARGSLSNRVAITKAIRVESVNGPAVTLITGLRPVFPNYVSIRAAYLTNGAVLSGFTISGSAANGSIYWDQIGGSIWCESKAAIVTNCAISYGVAQLDGGGVYGGTVINSSILNCFATNGGGAYTSTLSNCIVSLNRATGSGGGVHSSSLINCSLTSNHCRDQNENLIGSGGGAFLSSLTNCSVVSCMAGSAGGARLSSLVNCEMLDNRAMEGGGQIDCTNYNCLIARNGWQDQVTGALCYNGGGGSGGFYFGCVISNNYAFEEGAGVRSGKLFNCVVTANRGIPGIGLGGGVANCFVTGSLIVSNIGYTAGGSYNSSLTNCTVIGNVGGTTAGLAGGSAHNCLILRNTNELSGNLEMNYSGTLDYCFTTPLPTNGVGNLTGDPLLTDSFHLSSTSPCRWAGNPAYVNGKDLDGEAWLNPPSIGCDEFVTGGITGPLAVTLHVTNTNTFTSIPFMFTASLAGRASTVRWDFGDGSLISNKLAVTHTWFTPSNYPITFTAFNDSHPAGVSTQIWVQVTPATHYVSMASTNPVFPYAYWATAATNIQDAVDAALPGELVLVTNGIYASGGRVVRTSVTNRVAVTKPIKLESVNGPAATLISGLGSYANPDTNAVRCVYLTNGASISGFTLSNGYSFKQYFAPDDIEMHGGGIYCEPNGVLISNCVVTACGGYSAGGIYRGSVVTSLIQSNQALNMGGGTLDSIVQDSVLRGNRCCGGGGAVGSSLTHCLLEFNQAGAGAGARRATLNSCVVRSNFGEQCENRRGGGIYECVANNCLIAENTMTADETAHGGGAANSVLINCTVVGNAANPSTLPSPFGVTYGGGVYECTNRNTIIYGNAAQYGSNHLNSIFDYSSTLPLPANGVGNITNAPLFVNVAAGDFRLQSTSPGINSGHNAYVTNSTDLDGLPRISGGTVDLGAYEFQAPDRSAFTAWLQSFGLPGDGSADYTDPDDDRVNNWQEWVTGTNPTNAVSALRILSVTRNISGVVVTWTSVSNRVYSLERSANLGANPQFLTLGTNFHGQPDTTSFTDTNAPGVGPYFYRVGVPSGTNQVAFSVISYAWMQQYGLPTDGTADYADADGDRLTTWQEWRAGTVPTNAASVLRMLAVTGSVAGVTVRWQSVRDKVYWLERAANLGVTNSFALRATNLPSQGVTTSFTDGTATNGGGWFYRVGVQQ